MSYGRTTPFDHPPLQVDNFKTRITPPASKSRSDFYEYLAELEKDYEPFEITQIENLTGQYHDKPLLELRIKFKGV